MGARREIRDKHARCTGCGEWKPFDGFALQTRRDPPISSRCKVCIREYNNNRYARMPKHVMAQAKAWEQKTRRKRLDGPTIGRAKMLFDAAKRRAKKRGENISFDVGRIHSALQTGVCEQTGLPFSFVTWGRRYRNPFAPSVDRVDNEKGYESDNVQIVCNMFNYGKGVSDQTDFIAMCIAVAERNTHNKAAHARLKELRGE